MDIRRNIPSERLAADQAAQMAAGRVTFEMAFDAAMGRRGSFDILTIHREPAPCPWVN